MIVRRVVREGIAGGDQPIALSRQKKDDEDLVSAVFFHGLSLTS